MSGQSVMQCTFCMSEEINFGKQIGYDTLHDPVSPADLDSKNDIRFFIDDGGSIPVRSN